MEGLGAEIQGVSKARSRSRESYKSLDTCGVWKKTPLSEYFVLNCCFSAPCV